MVDFYGFHVGKYMDAMGYKMDLVWTYQNHVDKLMTPFGPLSGRCW